MESQKALAKAMEIEHACYALLHHDIAKCFLCLSAFRARARMPVLFVHSTEFGSHMTHKSNCFQKKFFASKLFAH